MGGLSAHEPITVTDQAAAGARPCATDNATHLQEEDVAVQILQRQLELLDIVVDGYLDGDGGVACNGHVGRHS